LTGIGHGIPAGALKAGNPYRVQVRVAAVEDYLGRGSLEGIRVSVYSGKPAPAWDAELSSGRTVESPEMGIFKNIEVDFTAGEFTAVHLIPLGRKPRTGGEFGFIVDTVKIMERVPAEPNRLPEKVMGHLHGEVMAFGLYLKHRCRE
jgi:hypothetical protein